MTVSVTPWLALFTGSLAPPARNVGLVAFLPILLSALLVVGLATPIVAMLHIVLFGIILSMAGQYADTLLLAGAGLSLCLLGPGAWSIDARLFGRKKLPFLGDGH